MLSVNANNKIVHLNLPQEKPLLQQNALANKVSNICNLPLEMKHKIISHLHYDDYASLRAVSKRFSEDFQSIDDMDKTLDEGKCKGAYKKELIRFESEFFQKYLQQAEYGDVRSAFENIQVRYTPREKSDLIIRTEYLPIAWDMRETYRIPQAIERCQRALPIMVFCSGSSSFIPQVYPQKKWSNELIFWESAMDVANINKVFTAFHTTYKDMHGYERILIAGFAAALKDAWLDKPPAGLSREDIAAIVAPYDVMFQVVAGVKKSLVKTENAMSGAQ